MTQFCEIFPQSYKTYAKKIKPIVKTIDSIPDELSMYDLRHTFITTCRDNNIPKHIVQHWCGQIIGSQVNSSVYTHINAETSHKYALKMK